MNSTHVQIGQGGDPGAFSALHAILDQLIAGQESGPLLLGPKLHPASTEERTSIARTDNLKQREGTMRREVQRSISVRPAMSPALVLGAQVISTVIDGKARLKSHAWTDQEITRIESEDLARLAYEVSETLQAEFQSGGAFISYWRRERSRLGLTSEPRKEPVNQATTKSDEQDEVFKQEWDGSAAVRAEFRDSFSTYVAYKRAEARGAVRLVCNRPDKSE